MAQGTLVAMEIVYEFQKKERKRKRKIGLSFIHES